MQIRKALALLVVLGTLVLPTAFGAESRVVKEVVLDTYSEDITYIPTGPFASHVAFLEDMKVVGYPASRAKDTVRTLLDFSSAQPTFRPNGLAYIETERRFAVVTRDDVHALRLFDAIGRLTATRVMEYPEGYEANFVEGLAYIPPGAEVYPDHLALCTGRIDPATGNQVSDILILERDGTLARQVHVASDYANCLGVAFQPPNRLLISGFDGDYGTITAIDFDGNIAGPMTHLANSVEGLVVLPSGEVLAIGSRGTVYSFDGSLQRQPQRDRVYRPDLGVSSAVGLAWDSGRDRFVVSGRSPDVDGTEVWALFNVAAALDGATKLAGLYYVDHPPYYWPGRLTFLPGESRIAMRQVRRRNPGHPQFVPESIQLFGNTDGVQVEEINLESLSLGNPLGIAWLPERQQFAVSFSGAAPGWVHLLNRAGAVEGTIDYSTMVNARVASLAFFNPSHPSGGQLLLSTGPTVFIGTLDGNITGQFPATEFPGMVSVGDMATVTSGAYEGKFAAVAGSRWGSITKLIIFTVDVP